MVDFLTYYAEDGEWRNPSRTVPWVNDPAAGARAEQPTGYTIPAAGVDRTGATNVAAALQSIITGGGRLRLDAGTYRCTSPLLLDEGSRIWVDAGAKLEMDVANSGATSSALIRTRDLDNGSGWYNSVDPSHDVWIHGPGEISQSATGSGNLFAIGGDRVRMVSFSTTRWDGGRHTVGIGDDWIVADVNWTGGDLSGSGNGGLRFMGGKRFYCVDSHCESGDDTWQFVPAGAFVDPFFDVSCEDGVYVNCTGSSSSARVLVLVEQDQNNNGTIGMSGHILRCGFIGCTGNSGGASVVIQNASSSGTIQDCYITNCTIDGQFNEGLGQPGALYLNAYADTGGIDNLVVDNLTITGSHRRGIYMDRKASNTTIRNSEFHRGSAALGDPVADLSGTDTLIENCTFYGDTGTQDVVEIVGHGFTPLRVTIDGCTINDVPANDFGVSFSSGSGHEVTNNTFTDKAGDTTGKMWEVKAGVSGVYANNNDDTAMTTGGYSDLGTGTTIGPDGA